MGAFLVLIGSLGFLIGLVNVIYPIRQVNITSRKMAAAILGLSFVTFSIGGMALPPSEPATEPALTGTAATEPEAKEKPDSQPAASAAATPAPAETAAPSAEVTRASTTTTATVELVPVVSVTDGDTIQVALDGKKETVRLIGVDTPETVHPSKPVEPYGPEASAYAKRRLTGQHVRLEFDVEERDHYGRLLAYVWMGEELFNASMVKDGYAQVLTIPPNVKYADRFVTLQREARANSRGLWGLVVTNPQPAPTPAPAPAPVRTAPAVYYKNCTEARAAGVTPIYSGQPGYGTHLDRDRDGVACE